MEHLFIYPVLLFITYLLYKVLKMKGKHSINSPFHSKNVILLL